MPDVIVIGAGLGGLSAAIVAAAEGAEVLVVEASSSRGGKAGEACVDGVSFDTGPSVLTLPGVLADVLRLAGVAMDDVVTLIRNDPAFCYRWPDGVHLNVFQDVADTVSEVQRVFGAEAAADFESFMEYSRGIWESAAPHFVMADSPSVGRIAALGWTGVRAVMKIDAMRTMSQSIRARVRSRHLQDLFLRFATYNGSDPRRAPATLNCIAHVEMGIGSYGIQGGIHRLPERLAEVAQSLGVVIEYDARVQQILVEDRVVSGVRLEDGRQISAKCVLANADVAHVRKRLLGEGHVSQLNPNGVPSTSGWTAVIRRKNEGQERFSHLALFPERYDAEFEDMFDHGRPPQEPTVYCCDQSIAHQRPGWGDASPLFVMANAPAEPESGASDPQTWPKLKTQVLNRLMRAGVIRADDEVVWERSPSGLADRFWDSRGALYGAASNSPFSAFQRPPNRLKTPGGLYLASGSAHPGGGMPLCIQSGRLAAECASRDGAWR